jgi:Tol biopolymer transport system component
VISNIWVAPNGDARRAKQITSSRVDGMGGISWTPDGKIVCESRASGNSDIWIMDSDGSNKKQLTVNAGANNNPVVSPDGHYIIFKSDRTGTNHIWRMDPDGSNTKQLTNGDGETFPDCSPDSQWVFYSAGTEYWKVPLDGGRPVKVTESICGYPAISPDGKLIASGYFYEAGSKLAIFPFEGGQPLKTFEISGYSNFRWNPDGRSIAYFDPMGADRETRVISPSSTTHTLNIWSQPIDGSSPKQLTGFKDGQIFRFNWSRDGKQLALARGKASHDVVLISDFRDRQ